MDMLRNTNDQPFKNSKMSASPSVGEWEVHDKNTKIWADDNIRMICHEDFDKYLLLAMQIKEVVDAMGRGSRLSPQEFIDATDYENARDLIKDMKNAQLPPGMDMPPILYRGTFPWIDAIMDQCLSTLSEQMKKLFDLFEGLSIEITINSLFDASKRKDSNSIAVKHPFYQTSYLIEWMAENSHNPYPSTTQIKELSMGSGLDEAQIVNWATNSRKRHQRAIMVDDKKPSCYLEFVFLSTKREESKMKIARTEESHPRMVTNKRTSNDPIPPDQRFENQFEKSLFLAENTSNLLKPDNRKAEFRRFQRTAAFNTASRFPIPTNIDHTARRDSAVLEVSADTTRLVYDIGRNPFQSVLGLASKSQTSSPKKSAEASDQIIPGVICASMDPCKAGVSKEETTMHSISAVSHLGENDVLFGRGIVTNRHEGNVRLRKLLLEHKLAYKTAKKFVKKKVSLDIVHRWRAQCPPGRFLEKTGDGSWHDVGNVKAQARISQCLRDSNRTSKHGYTSDTKSSINFENESDVKPPNV